MKATIMKTTADFYATIMLICILIVLALLGLYVNWIKTINPHRTCRIKRSLFARLSDFWHYWRAGMTLRNAWQRAGRVI